MVKSELPQPEAEKIGENADSWISVSLIVWLLAVHYIAAKSSVHFASGGRITNNDLQRVQAMEISIS